ncbi:MAG: SLC13 family permease [Pikeienuella sp.]|uniref:SLC13 family permease n=1 Tax=Pikeienuella sp. TaxID=2831957 RepID=UPI003919C3C4
MTEDQAFILLILAAAGGMFLWGKWRHDMVALGALLAAFAAGLVPGEEAFAGFGHPAVITVACVLILSRGLQTTGAAEALARAVLPKDAGFSLSLAALVGLGAFLSGFMNNVGAMALLMPIAGQMAKAHGVPPGRALMPLAFGTILGGMTTLIGTPPNLIVSGFRASAGGEAFGMFDFTPVGLAVALAGVAFVAFLGWRLTPAREVGGTEGFETGGYLVELRLGEESRAAGMTVRAVEAEMEGGQIVALVRSGVRIEAPHGARKARAGDILVVEAEMEGLADALSSLGLKLEEEKRGDEAREDVEMREYVVRPGSALAGRSASQMHLRTRFGVNLLAVARDGRRSRARLRTLLLKPGDLLLMQGPADALSEFAADTGAVPLAARDLSMPDGKRAFLAAGIMAAALLTVALGLVPAAIGFAGGALAAMATGIVPPRTAYDAVDWPVIVLLGALIPVAGAMETTGAAAVIADALIGGLSGGSPMIGLALILVVTMFLSDLVNNAATAAVMCPVALGAASALGVNPDAFLMAVAIGASCAFLTPIGHQNNTLILGPGGFGFGDYWRLGLPLEALVVAISVPLLPMIWPF